MNSEQMRKAIFEKALADLTHSVIMLLGDRVERVAFVEKDDSYKGYVDTLLINCEVLSMAIKRSASEDELREYLSAATSVKAIYKEQIRSAKSALANIDAEVKQVSEVIREAQDLLKSIKKVDKNAGK